MADRDPFEGAYQRLAATRVTPAATLSWPADTLTMDAPVRWAASRLLPRLDGLAPRRRRPLRLRVAAE